MSYDIFVELLQSRQISLLDSQHLQALATLPLSEYTQLVRRLLAGSDDRPLVNGCILFTLRPNPELYPEVLVAAYAIADPSENAEAIVALTQVKPADQVAHDLLAEFDRHTDDEDTLVRIFGLFYWLGSTAAQLTDLGLRIYLLSYQSAVLKVVDQAQSSDSTGQQYFPDLIEMYSEDDPARGLPIPRIPRPQPIADPAYAHHGALQLLKRYLDWFDRYDSGDEARYIISYVSKIDLDTLDDPDPSLSGLRERIIHALTRANESSDPYMRSLVNTPTIQSLLLSSQ